jgi:hypothetical protein
VGLVRTWTGQVARAAGATLIAPFVLLLASGVVASGGALGSVGSLREIASGPSLPDIGLASTPGSALEGAEVVGAGVLPPADVSRPPSGSPQQLASAAPPAPPRTASGVPAAPPQARPQTPRGEEFRLKDPTPTTQPGSPAAGPKPQAPAVPQPVDDLLEATRGVGEQLRQPLRPLTDAILNLLRPPPRQ